MGFARNLGVRLHWREEGGVGRPLLLLNSLGCDLSMWDAVVPHLKTFRVLRMDARGHGQSDSPPGNYTLDQLAADALAVLDAAGADEAAICGLSLGGMTAMTLGLDAPERVSALILACTSARMDRAVWRSRIETVLDQGMTAIVDTVIGRFFSEEFLRNHESEVDRVRVSLLKMQAGGYAGCGAAIRDMALLDRISAIKKPVLIVAGDKDISTPFHSHGSEIQRRIARSQVRMLPAAHLAPVEMPDLFAAAVTAFLSGVADA